MALLVKVPSDPFTAEQVKSAKPHNLRPLLLTNDIGGLQVSPHSKQTITKAEKKPTEMSRLTKIEYVLQHCG